MTGRRARVVPPALGGPGGHTRPHAPQPGALQRTRVSVQAVALAGLLVLAAGVAAVAQDRTRPDDPMFEDQWALENTGQLVNWTEGRPGADIDATRAWNLTTGSRSVVVAVVDWDFDYKADDLAPNVWNNPGGVKGCPAGSHGYDVPSGDCDPYTGGAGHGTHMGYVIGAVGDNDKGLAGVNWATSLMGVSMRDSRDSATVVGAIDWVIEARKAGVNVRVINASWGRARGDSPDVRSAAQRAGEHGILFVTSAGNAGDDNDANGNPPCGWELSNLICVAASDQQDELAPKSNYGVESVHLAAPGHHVCGTPHEDTCSGGTSTSQAAAHVSGVAALVWAHDPGLSVEEVRSKILGNVDERDALAGKVATGGRLNAYRAMTGPASWTDPSENDDSGGDGGGGSGGSDGGGGGADDTGSGDDGGGGSGGSEGEGGSDGGGSGGSDDGGGSGGSDDGGSVDTGDAGSGGSPDGGGGRRTIEGGSSTSAAGTDSRGASSGGDGRSGDEAVQGQTGDAGASEGGAGVSGGGQSGQGQPSVDLDVEGAGQETSTDDEDGGSGTIIVGGQGDDATTTGDEGGVSGWLWVALLAAAGVLALLARKPGGQAP